MWWSNPPVIQRQILELWHPAPVLVRHQRYENLRKIHPRHIKRKRHHQTEQYFLIASKFPDVGQQVVKVHVLRYGDLLGLAGGQLPILLGLVASGPRSSGLVLETPGIFAHRIERRVEGAEITSTAGRAHALRGLGLRWLTRRRFAEILLRGHRGPRALGLFPTYAGNFFRSFCFFFQQASKETFPFFRGAKRSLEFDFTITLQPRSLPHNYCHFSRSRKPQDSLKNACHFFFVLFLKNLEPKSGSRFVQPIWPSPMKYIVLINQNSASTSVRRSPFLFLASVPQLLSRVCATARITTKLFANEYTMNAHFVYHKHSVNRRHGETATAATIGV